MSRRARIAILALPVAFLLLFFVFPFVSIVWEGLASDQTAIGRVLGEARVRDVIWFTLWQAAASTALTLAIGLPIAYALSRFAFRGRAAVEALVVVPFVLPTVVVGMAFSGLRGSIVAILAAHVFFNIAVVVRVVGAAWATVDPELEDAADELGASGLRRFTRVLLPLARPAIVTAATLVFLFTFTSFGVVLLLGGAGQTTIEVEIFRRTSQQLDLSAAAVLALIQLLFVSVLLIADAVLASRRPVLPPPAEQGGRAPRTRGERTFGVVAVLGAIALVAVPLWRLVRRSFVGSEGATLANYLHIGEGRRGGLFEIDPGAAIWTSVRSAALAATIALVVGGLVSIGVALGARSRGIWAIVAIPLGVSAVTLGFGYVVAFDADPLDLRGSTWLVPLAQALVALPFVVRIVAPAMAAAHASLGEGAASLGASPWRALRDATLPACAGAIRTAAVFAFVVALGEFGATAFLARAEHPTVPVAIARLLGQPGSASIGQASALAVILLVITAAAALTIGRGRIGSFGQS
ncbi:MAG: iron ABC transporter permease [Actinomycetota bacterium]